MVFFSSFHFNSMQYLLLFSYKFMSPPTWNRQNTTLVCKNHSAHKFELIKIIDQIVSGFQIVSILNISRQIALIFQLPVESSYVLRVQLVWQMQKCQGTVPCTTQQRLTIYNYSDISCWSLLRARENAECLCAIWR